MSTDNAVLLSIIIPTHNRPDLLPLAVQSALAQTVDDFEVIVVDDASTEFGELPSDPRLRVIHLERSRGGAGARNVGTEAAKGRWITYLDDDDYIIPQMAEMSLAALSQTSVPAPVGAISGIEKVSFQGESLDTRLPPDYCPLGGHFFLEPPQPGRSYLTKQTLVVEREVILSIGGWDETFRSRVHSELFLRLNPACALIGVPKVTYHLRKHVGPRVSGNPALRQESFHRLIQKHRHAFESHPRQFAQFAFQHALISRQQDQIKAYIDAVTLALKLAPLTTLKNVLQDLRSSLPNFERLHSFTQP